MEGRVAGLIEYLRPLQSEVPNLCWPDWFVVFSHGAVVRLPCLPEPLAARRLADCVAELAAAKLSLQFGPGSDERAVWSAAAQVDFVSKSGATPPGWIVVRLADLDESAGDLSGTDLASPVGWIFGALVSAASAAEAEATAAATWADLSSPPAALLVVTPELECVRVGGEPCITFDSL